MSSVSLYMLQFILPLTNIFCGFLAGSGPNYRRYNIKIQFYVDCLMILLSDFLHYYISYVGFLVWFVAIVFSVLLCVYLQVVSNSKVIKPHAVWIACTPPPTVFCCWDLLLAGLAHFCYILTGCLVWIIFCCAVYRHNAHSMMNFSWFARWVSVIQATSILWRIRKTINIDPWSWIPFMCQWVILRFLKLFGVLSHRPYKGIERGFVMRNFLI